MASFEQQVQQWVSVDNQIRVLTEKIHELRDNKNNIGENLTSYIASNDLKNATIQISDGKLKFVTTKVTAPLTFKYVEKTLGEVIKNEKQVQQIVNYLKQKRETKLVPEIKRISNN
jgi:ribosomal protein S15P/S13E